MQNETCTLVKTIESPESVIRVFSPIITAGEREKRLKQIHNAAERLLKSAMTKKEVEK